MMSHVHAANYTENTAVSLRDRHEKQILSISKMKNNYETV
jgi:hypothetical protein